MSTDLVQGGPAPAPDVNTQPYLDAARKAGEEALKNQQEMMALSLKLNTAMAYLQMALSLSGKVAGR